MPLIVVTESAAADQADILEDLNFKSGKRTALKYRGFFSRLYDRLETHPASGPRRPALGADIRIGIISPYIVIYRYSPNEGVVTVLRIVDGRRDVTDKLLAGRR